MKNEFDFPIVNFRFMSSNIPAATALGVYISQLIRYCQACANYQDFIDKGLIRKLQNQVFLEKKLKLSLRKFFGRHHDVVDRYEIPNISNFGFFHKWISSNSHDIKYVPVPIVTRVEFASL